MKTVKSLLIVTLVACLLVAAVPSQAETPHLTPVVLFPGWFATALEVKVSHQTAFPECPSSGTFDWVAGNPNPSTEFSLVCQDKLLTLVLDPDRGEPMPERISNQRGVKVSIVDYGKTTSAPSYEPLYAFLEQAGYMRDVNIRVAGWDSRLTPDLGGFMKRTIALIEETYRQNGNTPVHLVGHSNGPLFAQYLLTHTSQAWKNRYIHGFTPIAGNWPGQGGCYFFLFTGLNLNIPSPDFPIEPVNVASSAAMYQSWPATYMTCADPAVFKNQEVVIGVAESTQYTPQDYRQLLRDAGMPLARELADHYLGIVKFATPKYFPNVDVYAEKGSGLETLVGVELRELKVASWASNVSNTFTRDGDNNQEDITNDSIRVWEKMRCYHFELNDNPGVGHIFLPMDEALLGRLLAHLQQPRSKCSCE